MSLEIDMEAGKGARSTTTATQGQGLGSLERALALTKKSVVAGDIRRARLQTMQMSKAVKALAASVHAMGLAKAGKDS